MLIKNNISLSPEKYNQINKDSSKKRNKKKFTEVEQLKFLIKKKRPIILDIGSNYGQSIIKYQKYFPNCIIHAFEPNKYIYNFFDEKYYISKFL